LLRGAREDGVEDLFDLLDEIETRQWEQHESPEPPTPIARRRWREKANELDVCRRTCEWLIEQGAEQVDTAAAMLLGKAGWLADRYGDREGLLTPIRGPAVGAPKVGRNDPCPCCSGRKYKRCCLGKA
jgi:hypothetical protein